MKRALIVILLIVVAALGAVAWLNFHEDDPPAPAVASTPDAVERVSRGRYLARVGNCAGCHTSRGGATYAGGRGIPTPFGIVFASNLTSDPKVGLGNWSSDDFWRALHDGRSRDGHLLYPAFPYTNYTEVTREDADALFAFLSTVPAAPQPNRPHELRFPYDSQAALAVWRALYFRPGVYRSDPAHDDPWNRGAYLVRGLGHCSACHSTRNLLGATAADDEFQGGQLPAQGWYAPSLTLNGEAGVGQWETGDVVDLLTKGVTPRATVLGPMAEVVYRSTQYLSAADATAIAVFLKSLSGNTPAWRSTSTVIADYEPTFGPGRKIFEDHCAGCHGKRGEGGEGVVPLAGNRAVMLDSPVNVIRAILSGGFPPGTASNPRPQGMPPFAPFLNDNEVASVATYIRNAWGNGARVVQGWEVAREGRGASSN